ncbi:MAG: hypothetical protein ACHQ51_02125 [Elusimicrobiota bacterium]
MVPKLAVLAVLALAAVPARAGKPDGPGDAAPAQSPCACAAKRQCWNMAMFVYGKRVGLSKEEVEKAMPNRFFPRTLTFALLRPTEDGHFLSVECGNARVPCTDKREELERRMIVSDILGSVPPALPEGTLYDPETWRITERGEKTFAELKSCRKGLAAELAAVVLGAGGE